MIRVRMTQNHMIDGRERGYDQLQIGEHAVAGSFRLIVARSRIVDQCEIGTTHQYAETGADIDDVAGEGWHRWWGRRRTWRHDRNHPWPTLAHKTGQSVRQSAL